VSYQMRENPELMAQNHAKSAEHAERLVELLEQC